MAAIGLIGRPPPMSGPGRSSPTTALLLRRRLPLDMVVADDARQQPARVHLTPEMNILSPPGQHLPAGPNLVEAMAARLQCSVVLHRVDGDGLRQRLTSGFGIATSRLPFTAAANDLHELIPGVRD